MSQSVLDGVVAIEARAAKVVDEAKARARAVREKVKAELDALARQLDAQAREEVAAYQKQAEARKAAAMEALDALERVRTERLPAAVDEVLCLLEQRGSAASPRQEPLEGRADGN